jgi:hypothetical protein
MNDIANELADEGHDVDFVFINGPADAFPDLLANKADFPIFQDTEEEGAWAQHGGTKDDMIIYTPDHTLHAFLKFGGPVNTNFSTPGGFENVKNAILDALGALP